MFFIIYAPLQFFLLYRLCPSAQFSVVNDLFQSMYSRSFVQIRKIKGKSCITCQIVVDIWKSSTATGKVNSLFCNMIGNLWWCTFQKCFHFCRDLIYAIGDSLINNIGGNNFFSGKSGNAVDSYNFPGFLFLVVKPSHDYFQAFGRMGPMSSRLDWVRLPPLLCMETDAMSAPAAMADTGRPLPK